MFTSTDQPPVGYHDQATELGSNWRLQFLDPDGLPLNMGSFEEIDFGAISYKEIFQNVKTILATPKFSAALERTLGVDQRIVDLPINEAGEATITILDALYFWEPRCEAVNIDFEPDVLSGHLTVNLTLKIKNVIYGTETPYERTNVFPAPEKTERGLPMIEIVQGPKGEKGDKGDKGDPGSIENIPDPLIINEVQVGTTIYIGQKMRVTKLINGGRLEVQNSASNWIVQSEWTES